MPLNFGGQKRSGAFDTVWPSAMTKMMHLLSKQTLPDLARLQVLGSCLVLGELCQGSIIVGLCECASGCTTLGQTKKSSTKILPGEEDFQSMKTSLTRHWQEAQKEGKNMCRCSCLLGDVGLEHCHAQHATDTTRHHEHMCKLTATHQSMQETSLCQRRLTCTP